MLGPVFIVGLIALMAVDAWLDTLRLPEGVSALFRDRHYLPSGIPLLVFLGVLAALAGWELAAIFRANQINASSRVTSTAAVVGLVMHYAIPWTTDAPLATSIMATGLVGMFVVAMLFYSRGRNFEGVVAAVGGTMFAMIYIGFMAGFYLALRRWESPWLIAAIILTTKSCDIGAYFTGKAIGKHKLIPWLSPGKTWEGLVGGVITSVVVASLLAWLGRGVDDIEVREGLAYRYHFAPTYAAAVGFLFGVVGQAGDLAASLLKRDAGIKDSSNVIPGFGGFLDVLDSPLIVAPLAYWVVTPTLA